MLSLTAFITVLFLSGIISFMIFPLSSLFIAIQSENACAEIQKEINTGLAARQLGINDIEMIDRHDPRVKEWIQSLNEKTIFYELSKDFGDMRSIYITIEINGAVVYSDEESVFARDLAEFYKDTESTKPIFNSHNREIGSVTVKVNGQIIIGILIILFFIIGMLSIAALIIAKVLNMFLVIPIIKPINQLEMKVKAIVDGDNETALHTQLTLKRPLREIESLMDSTNAIMKRFHDYNEQLEKQKVLLESQNEELEAQNEELTESKEQIQQQQAKLIQSEKMASVGMLTAAITHEINTPIGAINSNAQLEEMLLGQLQGLTAVKEDREIAGLLAQMKEVNDVNLVACERIIEIIRSLKSFSRVDQADFKEANINEGIKSVLVLTHNLLKRRITVHEDYEDIPPVKCYPGQLNQVFMNILVNASQAIEGEGDIYIHTWQQDRDICISIRDTGIGISSEDVNKLFDPGYTTKGVGVGLGLGLYISYNIIQNHKGSIAINSEPGKGAEFIIRIPMDNGIPSENTQ